MPLLEVGIDDTATATKKSEGWGFIALPPDGALALQEEVASFSGGKAFHASKCKKRNIRKYERFLRAINKVVSTHALSMLAHVFNDPSWHLSLQTIAQTAVAAGQLTLDPMVETALSYVMSPLMTLQRITASPNLAGTEVEVWMDECGRTTGFSSMQVKTAPVPISAASFTKAVYNGYRQCKFPAAPAMIVDGFHVVPDDKSILIQAADVFGNFAAAYAAWKLGATDVRALKGAVFGRVFDDPDITNVLPHLSLVGDHLEVSLNSSGTLKLLVV